MHEILVLSATLTGNLLGWARTAVGLLLWFWVISGAIFGLRFLVFMYIDRRHSVSVLPAPPSLIPFPGQRFEDQQGPEGSRE